jgi:hypothetical protein
MEAAVLLLAWAAVNLVVSAVALFIAATVLDGFEIDALTFPAVVILFTVILGITKIVTETVLEEHVQILASFVGLVAAFISLGITDWISDGLTITGIDNWLLGALIVWLGALITDFLVARWIFRKITGKETRVA